MRYDISYTTHFEYGEVVTESQNELRAAPATTATQRVVHYDVRTIPSSRVYSYVDYWGTRVDTFGVRGPHDQLVVTAEAVVETSAPPAMAASPRMAALDDAFCDEHIEYLQPSPHTSWGRGVTDVARERREQSGDDLVGFVLALHRHIGTTCEYTPGSTYVGVAVEDVLSQQQGVCQDFAHLMVALCRAGGVPARYVSGFLFAADESNLGEPTEDEVQVQTHAWAEVAIPGYGWWGLDPTNRQQVAERHVKIGHGRDYDDVVPLKGAYVGGGEHELTVTVDMRRSSHAALQAQQSQQ